eukprot:CAMPEP_0171076756 /NCGR_PEP_ID=MMETSP0766_2-20121228/13620_1 /TAXON_ID=439317 /ORGANISM="Gambierdiscus australes, Strain CAWD 149" /LENGTH=134 /DNA_ID=CAMNT_0011533757 /DNA_START=23 /DNA_END=427 /DNA_ORIENTATION=-
MALPVPLQRAILLCVTLATPTLAAEGVECKYKKIKGQGYHSPAVWQKVFEYEEAKKLCDEDEECTGFHYHPISKMYYLFKHGTELVEDPFVEDFTAYKKRMMTCEGGKGAEDDPDFDMEEGATAGEESSEGAEF